MRLRVIFIFFILLSSCSLGFVKDTDVYPAFEFHLTGQMNYGFIFYDVFVMGPVRISYQDEPLFNSDLKGAGGVGIYTMPFPKSLRKSGVILPAFGLLAGYGEYTYTKGVFFAPSVEANFLRGFGRQSWNFGMWFIRGRAFTVSGKVQGFIVDFGFRAGLPPSI